MRKATFGVGIVGLGIWLLWFVIGSMPNFNVVLSEEVMRLSLNILFVVSCLILIVLGLGKNKEE